MRSRSSMRVVSPAGRCWSSSRFLPMDSPLKSLHHVTATGDEAQRDLDFYTGSLGLRLVKKTVNFDNHFVYHFYYGNEHGTPSTIMTTFPYHGWGVPEG